MYSFSNIFPPLIAGAAFASSILALARYWGSLKEYFSLSWLCFAIGLGLWFLGEASWAVHTLYLGIELPYPSFADVFWLGGYIPMLIALLFYVKAFLKVLPGRVIYAITLAILVLAVLMLTVLAAPVFGAEEDLAVIFADFAYPILDTVLLYLAILSSAVFYKGRIGKSWLFITAGFISYTIADLLFSYTTTYGMYYCGHPLELLFHLGYLSLILAFHIHVKEL